ncbi:FAD-dependent oxidoreductase [Urbifossiella limnaea]|uniref:Putative FAD-binding dehydrogenase n=1 Tax=Urbifossiella limnaea TaxID=2528023 RepID=A0A517XVC7_9BACT|nr:FAD-dependent oxidoreductase [Urbifossiella limnaea]QDU21462.1 putative FAD-binding dehydrogenase [Urbifossiella limnaea]
MNRRAFLSLSAVSPLAHLMAQERPPPGELAADVVVVGAGVGGVACALAAARNGLRVVLTESFDWIGGQLTSQAVPPDEYPQVETLPCTRLYGTFRTRVRDFYRRNYPLTDAAKAKPDLNPGNGSVSKLCHEPRVAVAVLLELLAPHLSTGRIRLLQPYVPVTADVDGDRVRAVTVRSAFGPPVTLVAPYFVDATETGDLLPITRTEFVTGSEARRDTGEPHAAEVANPRNHQAFTVCFALDHVDGADHVGDEPDGYRRWRDYVPRLTPAWPGPLFSWTMSHPVTLRPRDMGFDPTGRVPREGPNLWTYRRIVDRANFAPGTFAGDVCLVNWPQNDYWLGNLFDDPAPGAALAAGRFLSRCLFHWMQTEAPRPDGRRGWKGLRLRPEITGTDDGLAMAPYVRESRRIKALFTVTETHIGTDARTKATGKKNGDFTAEVFPDSVGVGSYRIDLHPSSGGDNYVDVSSLPFQIPLGCLLPQRVENLLPACKNIGTTHVTNGCYRLHPVEWTVGEAVGELVAFALARRRNPRQVRRDAELLKDYQAALTKAGFMLAWPDNVAKQPR